jgi:serine/threonine protein kinase
MNVTRASTTNHVTILYRPKVENHGHPLTTADDSTTIDLQTGTGVAARTAGSERLTFSIDDQPPSSPSEIGRVLRDRYVLVDRLGSGGKGTVFKALDRFRADLPEAEQYVAIKILHATTDNREELLANLRREFYRTQMLSHRNIVNVFELDRDGDVDFFTMEFLEGELLSRVVGRLQLPMSRPQAWAIIREIGSGLEYAHSRNVVHADLKPHNIMITHSGEVRILDFGASSTSAEQSPEGRLSPRNAFSSVTPAYACCELLDGRSPDPSDDIYAFACLSYELLAGVHPFQRRRSTEARDLGIVPIRPLGLSRQQWQALTMGLSWHRAGRSISVRGWLNKLNTGRVAVGQLPRAHDLGSAPANPRPAVSFRAVALFAVLLICVTAWVSVARLAGRISGNDLVPSVAASTQLNAGPVPAAESVGTAESAGALESAGEPSESEGPLGKPPAASVAMDAGSRDAAAPNTPLQTLVTQSQAVNSIRRELNRSKPPTALTSPLVVSASDYRVRSGERFAEIRVYRSSPLGSDTPFVWWTEAASAKPGIDYVHQGKAIQSFRKGKSSTSFFVKLVPKASRTQPEVFYIAIAEAGRGASPGQVARAAVWLPTNNDQS